MGRKLKTYKYLIFCILLFACQTDTSWEKWTKNHIRPLYPPYEKNYDDLRFLDNLLSGKNFVILGEETHGEKVTTEYKIRLIHYLNKKLGYKILLSEGLNFYTKIKNDSSFLKKYTSLKYLHSDIFSPIYKLMSDSFLLLGIDTNQNLYARTFIDSLHLFMQNHKKENLSIDWNKMNQTNIYLYDHRNTLKTSQLELHDFLQKTESLIIDLQLTERILSDTFIFSQKQWTQKIKNRICELKDYQLIAQNLFLHKKFTIDSTSRKAIFLRDKQMAENIKWIKSVYPNEKFIIWSATVHGMKSYDIMKDPHRSRFNYRKSLRSYLDDWFPGQTYTIAFNDYKGNINDGKQLKGSLPTPSDRSLESVMNEYYPFSFIDFSCCNDTSITNQHFKANLVGGEKEGAWMQAVDGILFIQQQYPLY